MTYPVQAPAGLGRQNPATKLIGATIVATLALCIYQVQTHPSDSSLSIPSTAGVSQTFPDSPLAGSLSALQSKFAGGTTTVIPQGRVGSFPRPKPQPSSAPSQQPPASPAPVPVPEPSTAAPKPQPTATTQPTTGGSSNQDSVDSLVNDVYGAPFRDNSPGAPWGANQAVLRGIPSNFDWAAGAVGRNWDTADYHAVTPWGQIFEAGNDGSPVRNVRVQVRSLEVFWLINGKWSRASAPSGSDGKVEGGYYSGTFSDANSMSTADDGNGISSFALSPIHDTSHPVAHFWWSGWYPRPSVPAGATAMHISVMMRLVSDGTAADLSKAKYIAGVGIDEDKDTTDVPGGAKGSLGMPRHKMLSASWQRFGFTNLTEQQIRQNPPPVDEK